MKNAYIVVGLGYGDEGKGTIVDYLSETKQVDAIVKFNGGSQAAHNVVTPEGMHHTFSQFGSGSFHGTKTALSKFVFVDPLAMIMEGKSLDKKISENAFNLMYIDIECQIITPYHRTFNRLIERSRKSKRHGSCGVGFGIAKEMSLIEDAPKLKFKDLSKFNDTVDKLSEIKAYLKNKADSIGIDEWTEDDGFSEDDIAEEFLDLYRRVGKIYDMNGFLDPFNIVVFEGAQGALLDEWKGFNPHTTWSTTTRENADTIIKEYSEYSDLTIDTHCIGVTRTFSTRHGAGPFVSCNKDKSFKKYIEDDHNTHNPWQAHFRLGYLDLVMLKYALSFSNIDSMALTHYDKIQEDFKYVSAYSCKNSIPMIESLAELNNKEHIEKIKRKHFNSLDYSEALTEMLFKCEPEIEVCKYSIIALIREELRKPISILSFGQTCKDKSNLMQY